MSTLNIPGVTPEYLRGDTRVPQGRHSCVHQRLFKSLKNGRQPSSALAGRRLATSRKGNNE